MSRGFLTFFGNIFFHARLSGCIVLSRYGVVVNLVRWDFSKLPGVYVAVFAVVRILRGLILFRENVPQSTKIRGMNPVSG